MTSRPIVAGVFECNLSPCNCLLCLQCMRRIPRKCRASAMLLLAGALLVLLWQIPRAQAGFVQQVVDLLQLDARRFKYEGLIDAGDLGLRTAKGLVAATGDVNGNQLCVTERECGYTALIAAVLQTRPFRA